jgi:hypothetical protein
LALDPTFIFPVIALVIIGVAFILVAVIAYAKSKPQKAIRYRTSHHQKYVPGEFSGQMEFDMRQPYRRFKQLYPGTRWTYEEYKRLQMQRAFRRSMSSQENKRMVR